ncbi:twin-arginine translocase subunit TatC [Desulfovibrio sp. OttesenSCG-928-I05]|nr:twin-arginine translocase subunit TatC [Desulfovibrio sp. OttesenSCG-928-I05]
MTRAPLRPAARKHRRMHASALRRRPLETLEIADLPLSGPSDEALDDASAQLPPAPEQDTVPASGLTEHPAPSLPETDASPDESIPETEESGSEAEASASEETAAPEEAREDTPPVPADDTASIDGGQPDADKAAEEATEEEAEKKDENDDSEELSGMSLREHLVELRTRLLRAALCIVVGFFVCFGFAKTIYSFLTAPLESVLPADSFMIFTGLPEGFLVEVRVAFFAAIFLTSPLIFYQIWSFVAPGLYKEERRFVIPVALTSAFFFICGALFCYFFVFPVAFEFFMSYSTGKIKAAPSVAQYLSFVTQLLLAFGLVFELPLFCFFLGRLGILKAAHLRKWRPYSILGCFILAALLTPPDVYSQLLMVGPLVLLYEVSILIVALFGKKDRKKRAEEEQTETDEPLPETPEETATPEKP